MISGAIFSALTGLAGAHVYPVEFPQAPDTPQFPAIRYVLAGADSHPALCGDTSVDDDTTDYQIDVAAMSFGAMITLRDQVIAAFRTFDPPAERAGMWETRDEATKAFRTIMIWRFYPSSQ